MKESGSTLSQKHQSSPVTPTHRPTLRVSSSAPNTCGETFRRISLYRRGQKHVDTKPRSCRNPSADVGVLFVSCLLGWWEFLGNVREHREECIYGSTLDYICLVFRWNPWQQSRTASLRKNQQETGLDLGNVKSLIAWKKKAISKSPTTVHNRDLN